MALFNFGKKKKETDAPACCSSRSTDRAVCADDKPGGIRSVKVLGAGCKSCHTQYENAKAAVKAMGLPIEVEYVTDMQKVMAYGVMSMPAIVVNETVVSMGSVRKADDVEALLRKLEGEA